MFNRSSKFKGQVLKKWRLFEATDFESLMYPCFTFCRLLGIFPYKINASTFKISKPYYVLSTILTCAVCVYEFMLLYELKKSKKADIVPWIIQETFYCMLYSFITIVTFILSSPRMHLLQTIKEISTKLSSKTYKKLSRLIHVKDIFCFFFYLILLIVSCKTLNYNLTNGLYQMYISLVAFQMDMLYFNCVCILKACFKRINDSLANLLEPVVENMPYIFSRNYKQRNAFLMMELKSLKKQHLMISDTVQILNLVFSLQLLASIIINFSEITFSLYFYASQGSGLTDIIQEDFWNVYFILMLYHILKLSSIIWACETGKNQALEISTIIHVISNRITDSIVKNELQLFSLQILHRKNVFAVKGLNIDARLLTTIFGKVTTYVVILIQFLFKLNSCYEKSTNNILRE